MVEAATEMRGEEIDLQHAKRHYRARSIKEKPLH
jgi:hypothetical protein